MPHARRFQNLTEQNVSAGVNDDSQVGTGWKIANYPVPAADVAQIFRDVDWAVQRHGFTQITQHFLQRQARAQAIAVGVFGLDDDDAIGRLDKLLGGIKHSFIIADEVFTEGTIIYDKYPLLLTKNKVYDNMET